MARRNVLSLAVVALVAGLAAFTSAQTTGVLEEEAYKMTPSLDLQAPFPPPAAFAAAGDVSALVNISAATSGETKTAGTLTSPTWVAAGAAPPSSSDVVSYAVNGELVQLESAGFISSDGTVNATAITAALMSAIGPGSGSSLGLNSFTINTGVVAERFTHELGTAISFSPDAATAAVASGLATHLGLPVESVNVTGAEFTRTDFQMTIALKIAGNHSAVAAAVAALTASSASTVAAQSMAALLCGAQNCVDSWVHVLPPTVTVVASASGSSVSAPPPPEYTWQFYLNASVAVTFNPMPASLDGSEAAFESAIAAALGVLPSTVFVTDIVTVGNTATFDIQIVAPTAAEVSAISTQLTSALNPATQLQAALGLASAPFFGSVTAVTEESTPVSGSGLGSLASVASLATPAAYTWQYYVTDTIVLVASAALPDLEKFELQFEMALASALGVPNGTVFVTDVLPINATAVALEVNIVVATEPELAGVNGKLTSALAQPATSFIALLAAASPVAFGNVILAIDEAEESVTPLAQPAAVSTYTWEFYLNDTVSLHASSPLPVDLELYEPIFENVLAGFLGVPQGSVFVTDMSIAGNDATFEVHVVADTAAHLAEITAALAATFANPAAFIAALQAAAPAAFGTVNTVVYTQVASATAGTTVPAAATPSPAAASLVAFTATVIVYGYDTTTFGSAQQADFKAAVAKEIAVIAASAVNIDSVVAAPATGRRSLLQAAASAAQSAVAVTFTAMVPSTYDQKSFALTMGSLTSAGLTSTSRDATVSAAPVAGAPSTVSPSSSSSPSKGISTATEAGAAAAIGAAALLIIALAVLACRRRKAARFAARAAKISDKIATEPVNMGSGAPFLMPRRITGGAEGEAGFVDLALEESAGGASRGASRMGSPAASRFGSPASGASLSASRGRVTPSVTSPSRLRASFSPTRVRSPEPAASADADAAERRNSLERMVFAPVSSLAQLARLAAPGTVSPPRRGAPPQVRHAPAPSAPGSSFSPPPAAARRS